MTNLEISSSHIPFPTGFRTARWLQLDGCGKLEPYPPPPPEASPVHIKPEIPEPPDLAAIVVRRETGSGHAALRVGRGPGRPRTRLPPACPMPIAPKRASCRAPGKRARGETGEEPGAPEIVKKCVKIER